MMKWGWWSDASKLAGAGALLIGVVALWLSPGGARNYLSTEKAANHSVIAKTAAKPATAEEHPRWQEAYVKLPLHFEENRGQAADAVRYVAHGSGYELFLTPQEAVLALCPSQHLDFSPLHRVAYLRALRQGRRAARTTAIRLQLEGANPSPQISGEDRLPTRVNYFIGNDPAKWHTDVPSYSRVKYAGVYPGVDLVFYGNERRLEYDFIVAPGADPSAIQLKITGARKMRVNARGDVLLNVTDGEVALQKPIIYQEVNDSRKPIAGHYVIAADHRVRFSVADYDHSAPLILDPVLNYSTYLGGSGTENNASAAGIAVDKNGNAFVTGQTTSIDFPVGTNGAIVTPPNPNSGAVFVAEIDPTGTKLLYSTYLAGSTTNAGDTGAGIAVDSAGKAYVTGVTFATDFPTTSNAVKGGTLASNPLGTAFVTKLDPTQTGKTNSLLYSTFLGGTGGDNGNAIAVDASGNAYVAGFTNSTDFPTLNPFQGALATGNTSGTAFVSRIDTTKTSSTLIYSTYLGGNGANSVNTATGRGDEATGIAVDTSNVAYVVGTTSSTNFPVSAAPNPTPFQPGLLAGNNSSAAFVSKIDTTKTGNPSPSLIYSSYLGGTPQTGFFGDQGNAIALGPNNIVYVTGTTNANTFPVSPGAFDTSGAASGKAYVTLFDTTQSGAASLKYSTFLGGTGGNTGFGIQADASGNAYVGGETASGDFPFPPKSAIVGGFEPTFPAGATGVGFISKLNPAGGGTSDLLYSTFFGGIGTTSQSDQVFSLAIDGANPPHVYVTGQTLSTSATFPVFPANAVQTNLNGTSDAFVAQLTLIPTLAVSSTSLSFGKVPIGTANPPTMTVTLTNNTNATITFTSAAISSGSPAAANTDYSVSANTCSGGIASGASPANQCAVTVKFNPTVAATETATLVLTDSDSTSPQNIALTGTGSPDFKLSGPSGTQNVTAGNTLTFTVTMTPLGGFNSAVALTCTGAPTPPGMCNVTPSSVTSTDGVTPQTAQVSMTTVALLPPMRMPAPQPPLGRLVPMIVTLVLALLILVFLPKTKSVSARWGMLAALILFALFAGCSGPPKPGTPKAPGVLTITGTSGALTHSAQVNFSVQ